MFKVKRKAYRVILNEANDSHSMMLVLGCEDMDECIRFATKTKNKDQKIFDVQEIK